MTRQQLEPGPDHPITITPTAGRVTVQVAGRTIADSTNALTLQEADYPAVQYLPLADVDAEVLVRSDTQTYCPFKGDASYYSVRTGDGELADAIWTYEQPYPAVAEIKEHAAFYADKVDIRIAV